MPRNPANLTGSRDENTSRKPAGRRDINLIGEPFNSHPPKQQGFLYSAAGIEALEKIQNYFRNVAVWLAPPKKQRCMRNRLWWGSLYLDPLIMIRPKLPLITLGRVARDAMGKFAPQCTVYWWWKELFRVERLGVLEKLLEDEVDGLELLPEFVLGQVIRSLRERFPQDDPPLAPPNEKEFEAALDGAAELGLAAALEAVRKKAAELQVVSARGADRGTKKRARRK